MKKAKLVLILFILAAFNLNAQMSEKWLTDESSTNGNEQGVDVATDASGNAYVVGKKDNGTDYDIYLIKYNSSGVKQWIRTIDGGDDDIPVGIEIDASDNIYIGGNTVVSGINKLTAVMYNSAGTFQWQYTSIAAYETKVYSIDLNGTSLHLAGYAKPTASNTNAFFVKLSSTGSLAWAQSYDNATSDIANDIKVRATTGDVYATGTTGTAAFTLKLNSSGTQQWAQTYSSASGMAIAIGGLTTSFAVYMTGTVNGDGLTVKYNDSGVQQWSETVPNGTTYNFSGTDIVFYSSAIYVAVKSDHIDADSRVIKYNTSGDVQWTYVSPAKNELGLLINGGYLYASIWYHAKVVRLNMTTGADDLYYSWGEFHNAVGSDLRIYSITPGSNNDILVTGYHKESADPYNKICLLDICTPTFAVELTSTAGGYSCENYPFTISATAGASSYEWSFYAQYYTYLPYVHIDDPSAQSTNALISNAFPESSGLYLLVEAMDAYGCPDYDSTLMIVRPQPNLSVSGNNVIEEGGSSACEGESIEMHTQYDYQETDWYHNGVWYDYTMWGGSIYATESGSYYAIVYNEYACSDTTETDVLTFYSTPAVELGSNIASCTGQTVSIDAGSWTSYLWSTGATTQTIDVTTADTYSVTVSNAGGCSASDNISVSFNTAPSIELGSDIDACNGETINLNAGTAASYLWSTSATTQTIGVTSSGTYSVIITDSNGCTNTDNVSVTFHANPVVDLGSDISICGTSGATLDAGTGMSSYNWSSGQTSQTISPTASGTYSVTITNSDGCTDNDDIQVTYNTIPSIELGAAQNACDGETVTLNAGTAASYLWSTAATTQTINVTTTGTYNVVITGSNGCTNTDDVSVTFHTNPAVNLGSDINVCEGTGVILDAGSATSYSWSNGGSGQTISPVTSGTYSVTITDANGCEGTDAVLLTINELPVVNLGPDFTSCTGSSVILDAGAGADSYLWSDASTGQTISVTTAGTYSVTVTTSGCSSTDVIVADFEDNISINLGSDISSCAGENVSIDAGSGFDTYLWSTGSTEQSITATANGTYSVTVTSGSCPNASDAITVTFNDLPVIDMEEMTEACVSTTVDAGVGFTGYLWSTTETTQSIIVVADGIYSVTVTDGNGCENSAEISVAIFDNPIVNLGSDIDGCGSVILDEGSGSTENTYLWSTGATTPTIEVLTTGTYNIVVTDVHGCTGTDNIIATVFEVFTLESIITNATCGNNDGSATVNVTGGTPDFEYLWSTGEISATASGLAEGDYTVVVTDANGCTNNLALTISNTNAPVLTMNQSAALCFGECNGTASAVATGGTAPYTYLWSNSEETAEITGLCAGTYMVTITDDNGCEVLDTVEISQPEIISATFEVTDDLMSTGTAEGAIVTTVTGGTGTYTYLWENGETTADISNLEPGYYTVTITDANECTFTEEVYVDGIIDNISGIETTSNIKVFPNPSSDGIFNVVTPYEINKVEIFNLMGEKIKGIENFDRIIDLSEFTEGVYMARVFTKEGKMLAHKLVVK